MEADVGSRRNMDRYELMALAVLSLFLIPIGYVVYWIISIIRSPKLPPMPEIGTESWEHAGQMLTIVYRKDSPPERGYLDQIKRRADDYHALVLAHIDQTGEYKEDTRDGIILEGMSFPLDEDERADFDFSLDYRFEGDTETFLEAYFKNEKVKSLSAGD
jgi:hypothetical protein